MKKQIFTAMAIIGLFSTNHALADGKVVSPKAKAANEAHSSAPAMREGAAATGSAAGGDSATGAGLQGLMSPEMTKFITAMKKCHMNNKTDKPCHDGVIKNCEAKLSKEDCGKIMSSIKMDKKSKM
jgi:hypothetical protein